jgi:hypothetical protein
MVMLARTAAFSAKDNCRCCDRFPVPIRLRLLLLLGLVVIDDGRDLLMLGSFIILGL